ncbi:MAG: tRNA pseudouridine(55) synthase TruB [Clostridia bacterium]|nr:tRNA pseudouridine(55) synthase TruB [Clostridia bacterium]
MQGLILLNKPAGVTSVGAVARVRRIFGEKRAGHTGTLDPMATGVLPILLGRATRLSGYLLEADKRYTADVLPGVVTDTLDITGKVVDQRAVSLSRDPIERALCAFRGEIEQVPPMYSALKKDGQRLYDLARRGVEVERERRRVNIKKLELVEITAEGHWILDVVCSKGTYIRTLADDLGRALGCGATLAGLCRTETAGFALSECVSLEELPRDPAGHLLPVERCLGHLAKVAVTEKQASRFANGGELSLDRLPPLAGGDGPLRVYGPDGALLGLGDVREEALKVVCLLTEEDVR